MARIDTLVTRFRQDVNGRSITGFSPLRSALLYGSVEAMHRLMELGANPNEVVRPSWLPLWLTAIHEAHRPFVDQKLLALRRGGASTEVRSPEGLSDQALMQQRLDDLPEDPHVQAMARAFTVIHETWRYGPSWGNGPSQRLWPSRPIVPVCDQQRPTTAGLPDGEDPSL